MREFSKISPNVWRSQRFNDLPTDDARYLYLYFLTCEHQTNAGAYRLPDGYACDDLKWQKQRYHNARQELLKADLIVFDDACSVVMIQRWFKHNPPINESHLRGVERTIDRIEGVEIARTVADDLAAAWQDVLTAKAEEEARKKAKTTSPPKPPSPHLLATAYVNGGGARQ